MRITDSDRILRVVGDLDRFLVDVLDPILRERGLGREHWQVLRLLAEGPEQMGRIASAIGLSGATATRVVDVLVQRMLVERRNDPLDRRRVLVHLSALGRQTLDRVQHEFHGRAASALAGNGHDPHHQLFALLERFVTTADAPTERL